jgi:hypothetical protein
MKNARGETLYVGKAKSLKHRVRSYFSGPKDVKTRHLLARVADFEVQVTASEAEALLLENNLIKRWKPKYNINLKDGKTYPVIRLTAEEFRGTARGASFDGSRYYGPTSVGQIDLYQPDRQCSAAQVPGLPAPRPAPLRRLSARNGMRRRSAARVPEAGRNPPAVRAHRGPVERTSARMRRPGGPGLRKGGCPRDQIAAVRTCRGAEGRGLQEERDYTPGSAPGRCAWWCWPCGAAPARDFPAGQRRLRRSLPEFLAVLRRPGQPAALYLPAARLCRCRSSCAP